jgi:hypothetical protein
VGAWVGLKETWTEFVMQTTAIDKFLNSKATTMLLCGTTALASGHQYQTAFVLYFLLGNCAALRYDGGSVGAGCKCYPGMCECLSGRRVCQLAQIPGTSCNKLCV